jgi:hypothetical protein
MMTLPGVSNQNAPNEYLIVKDTIVRDLTPAERRDNENVGSQAGGGAEVG